MIHLSHPTGNANVRAALSALEEAGLLGSFYTTLRWDSDTLLAEYCPKSLAKQLRRREYTDISSNKIAVHPWRELGRLAFSQFNHHLPFFHNSSPFSIDNVCRSLDRYVARKISSSQEITGVYAYEDIALETFSCAEKLGIKCIYDLPIGYWKEGQRIYNEEAVLNPMWVDTLCGLRDNKSKLNRKEQEINKANIILVASSYVRKTLITHGITDKEIVVIPYGAHNSGEPPLNKRVSSTGPLKVLFVGSLGQRKGLSYLLDAVNELGNILQLTLIGKPTSANCTQLNDALARHRWIPSLPHSEILAEMNRHDVLVFPSLFEGFGLVITEALSQGIPVIATYNTAAPDLITHGLEGFLIPIRSSERIAEHLLQLYNDRQLLKTMSIAASLLAKKLTWTSYKERLVEVITEFI